MKVARWGRLSGPCLILGLVAWKVVQWRDEIVFLYRVVMGAANRSYGIHVAKLAGLPAPVA